MKTIHFVVGIILLKAINIDAGQSFSRPKIQGHLPTPEEGCGFAKVSNTRIIGGTPAKNGAWPWMALLFYYSSAGILHKPTYNCGGSLITVTHVLTAAHCITDKLKFVRLGEHDTTTDDRQHQDIEIFYTKKHENYFRSLRINDIGIIYLAQAARLSDRIRPICLPVFGDLLKRRFVDSNPFLAGWGTTHSSGPEKNKVSKILMQVQVPVVSNTDCAKSYKKIGQYQNEVQFDDRVVCAGHTEGGKDSCAGDSGGPLMLPIPTENGTFPFYQIGIVSWAHDCAQAGVPGVNTNVQYYADWIKSKISKTFV